MKARLLGGLVALLAVATIAASTGAVLLKDHPARLAVSVHGVPGYVYYDRPYELTVEYANLGGSASGPLDLVAQLPETFALLDRTADPSAHGARLAWQLDSLDAGEFGSVTFTVKGRLPADLTDAVYDLPGYAGHTAFVEGFQLAVTLMDGDQTASKLAIADTGEVSGTIRLNVTKVCVGAIGEATFSFATSHPQGGISGPLACGALRELGSDLEGVWSIEETISGENANEFGTIIVCDNGALVVARELSLDLVTGDIVNCDVINIRAAIALSVVKVCAGDSFDATFDIAFEGPDVAEGTPGYVYPDTPYAGVQCGDQVEFLAVPDLASTEPTEFTLTETIGGPDAAAFETLISCTNDVFAEAVSTPLMLDDFDQVTCVIVNMFAPEDETDGDGDPDGDDGGDGDEDGALRQLICTCPVDIDLEIDNANTNTIGIDNANANDNANGNANSNGNGNANDNANDNQNENAQDQTNSQDLNNGNEQTNNITSSPEVNLDFD